MSEERIKRILVALDSSETNKSLLQAATQLAGKLNAQLQALFVEDMNLLRMAQLPIAREITSSALRSRQLNITDMERQLRSQVERLRHFVETTALQFNLPVEFKVMRGQIAAELCTAVEEMDLLIVGKNTQLQRYSEKLGGITQDMLFNAKCNLLLMRHGASLEKPVAVLYAGNEASQRALHMAILLAQGDEGQLTVLYPATDKDQSQLWQEQVNTATAPYGISAEHHILGANTSKVLLSILAQHKARVVILNTEQTFLNQSEMQQFIGQCQTPLVLIR